MECGLLILKSICHAICVHVGIQSNKNGKSTFLTAKLKLQMLTLVKLICLEENFKSVFYERNLFDQETDAMQCTEEMEMAKNLWEQWL